MRQRLNSFHKLHENKIILARFYIAQILLLNFERMLNVKKAINFVCCKLGGGPPYSPLFSYAGQLRLLLLLVPRHIVIVVLLFIFIIPGCFFYFFFVHYYSTITKTGFKNSCFIQVFESKMIFYEIIFNSNP